MMVVTGLIMMMLFSWILQSALIDSMIPKAGFDRKRVVDNEMRNQNVTTGWHWPLAGPSNQFIQPEAESVRLLLLMLTPRTATNGQTDERPMMRGLIT